MLALRLARGGHPLVQLRRLLVAAASAGTGFLLLCTLGYALSHPDASAAGALRLAWCVVPLAATVYFAVAVARTDPATRPRPGLSAIGLGPGRLMAISAATTALSTLLGSLLALVLFLHLRGDLTGIPFGGAATDFLASGRSLPLPAALTLLVVVPVAASGAAALALRPRGSGPVRAAWSYGRTWMSTRQNAVAGAPRPGTRGGGRPTAGAPGTPAPITAPGGPTAFAATRTATGPTVTGTAAGLTVTGTGDGFRDASTDADGAALPAPDPRAPAADGPGGPDFHWTAEAYASGETRRTAAEDLPPAVAHGTPPSYERPDIAYGDTAPSYPHPEPAYEGAVVPGARPDRRRAAEAGSRALPPAQGYPNGLPWGAATLAAGLAVETYASRSGPAPAPALALPGGFVGGPAGVLLGWVLTAVGLALAGPAITYLCGWLLQAVRPGAMRLLAGRVLQAEARRIGQPLGVVCAVASGGFAMTTLYTGARPAFGPLTTLGALLVAGCTLLTLATAAVEARQARADTTAALLRLGAPATMLRGAAALRAGALFVAFAPLTWAVAELAALPLVT
uniref:Integral membrane protein n=1 Tax=Streptomyces sp. NBC_01393 TaxID=2903851 RepID=A0AAU3I664_9ACTN